MTVARSILEDEPSDPYVPVGAVEGYDELFTEALLSVRYEREPRFM